VALDTLPDLSSVCIRFLTTSIVNIQKLNQQQVAVGSMQHRPPALPNFKSTVLHHASNPPKRRMGGPGPTGIGGMANMTIHPKPHPGMLRSPPQRKEKDPLKEPVGGGKIKDDNSAGVQLIEESRKVNGGTHFRKDKDILEEKPNGRRVGGSSGVNMKGGGGGGGGNLGNGKVGGGGDQVVRRSVSEGTCLSGSGYAITALQPPPTSKSGKIRPSSSTPSTQSQVQSGGTTYFYSGQQVMDGLHHGVVLKSQ